MTFSVLWYSQCIDTHHNNKKCDTQLNDSLKVVVQSAIMLSIVLKHIMLTVVVMFVLIVVILNVIVLSAVAPLLFIFCVTESDNILLWQRVNMFTNSLLFKIHFFSLPPSFYSHLSESDAWQPYNLLKEIKQTYPMPAVKGCGEIWCQRNCMLYRSKLECLPLQFISTLV